MINKQFKTMSIKDLIPYENNPRINDDAVNDVIASIEQCENLDPIEIDEDNVILSGHTRLKALKKLKYKETEVLQITGLTEEQKRKYRILANKTGERAEWDLNKLEIELADLDFEGYDFDFDGIEISLENNEIAEPEEEIYTQKTDIPQYTPTDTPPQLSECVETIKRDELVNRIEKANISQEQKHFLLLAAARHVGFNYKKIADYYASANKEMQTLMEQSALVIIDYNDAIMNGYAELRKTVTGLLENE